MSYASSRSLAAQFSASCVAAALPPVILAVRLPPGPIFLHDAAALGRQLPLCAALHGHFILDAITRARILCSSTELSLMMHAWTAIGFSHNPLVCCADARTQCLIAPHHNCDVLGGFPDVASILDRRTTRFSQLN